ncbi:MAG TPA: acetyl-CoA carboxylase biotin carboxyl carrier protein subunit, partial [Hyphomicrobiaceae bacterium]|nr:acetyl-CoA carboxylase biotin carboxyl carrier protein subunit [Hyphomicrobiaceae bacterium]
GGPRVVGVGNGEAPAVIARTLVVGDGNPIYVLNGMRQATLCWPTFDASVAGAGSDDMSVRAPIIGRVAKLFVREGERVAKGDRIAVVEAMKMEHVLHAPGAGRVAKLAVKEGQQVTLGAAIATLAPAAEND